MNKQEKLKKIGKKYKKSDYYAMKRKLYRYILLSLTGAVLLVFLLRQCLKGVAGNWIVALLERLFLFNEDQALMVYRMVIRNSLPFLFLIATAISFFLLFRVLLRSFIQYFDEVNNGIDVLMQNKEGELVLSPEIDFMEQKLNALRQTLKKREQDAWLAEQRKNDLVMYLAHDIKTPLTSVIGYLNLLHEAPDMPPEQKAKYVQITLDKAYRLEQLIDEFFEITRYNLQTIQLTKVNIDLPYMLLQMTDEFYPQLSAKGKTAVLHTPEDLVVYGDPDKLARVLNNVLKNAIAYGADNSAIEITAEESADEILIRFTNQGTLPREKLDTIFDKFYRLDASRSTNTGGSGLGLAVAREIINLHGGSIHAESQDGTTTFYIHIPKSTQN